MNRINEFNLEPGPYSDQDGFKVVVLDVVTHSWNDTAQLQEALPEPLVMVRDLIMTEHRRYVYPLSIFKAKFT